MKQLGKDILASVMVGVLLPAMILNYGAKVQRQALQKNLELKTVEHTLLPVKVRDKQGCVTEQNMDDYLVGVVLAEMPASFEPAALKAQSIVARTYARKAFITAGKHGDGSVCTQPSCCQGYISPEEYIRQGGRETDLEKIHSAVLETSGQVLTFAGELIEATYFSCSGGSTEDAKAVWGTDYPYLQAVNSPGEEAAACYQDSCSFSQTELEDQLGISLTGLPESWIQSVSYTQGGGVDAISIGGTFFTGVEVRQKLALKSTAFSVKTKENGLEFTTRGYGHRVGMSQYGADAMAVAGSSCQEILMHYYQGTKIVQIE